MFINEIATWVLVFARIGAWLAVLPMFSLQHGPVRLRIALSGLLALLLCPFLPETAAEQMSVWSLSRLLFVEVSVGLLLGFVCRLVFLGLDAAGSVISTEMGLSLATEFNQFSGAQTAIPGMILYWLALMLWFSLDLHHWMIAAVQRSYALVPVGGAHLSEALLHEVVRRSAAIFVVAVQVAAPVLGVSFVISLVFSMLGRAVPQMNVFAESFAVRTLLGLFVFGSTALFMGQHIVNYLRRLPEDVVRLTQILGTG